MLEHTPLMTGAKPKLCPVSVATRLLGVSRAGSLPAAPYVSTARGASSVERDWRRSLWRGGSPPARALRCRRARHLGADLLFYFHC